MKASNYIAGQWVEGKGSFNNINPSDTSDQIDSYTSATAEQFEQAVQAAINAQKEWEKVGIEKKSQILIKIGDELIAKSKEQVSYYLVKRESLLRKELEKWLDLDNNFNITAQNAYVYMEREFHQLVQAFK